MRKWGAIHGGVYVPISEKTPPNPYLAHLPNRDIVSNDGQSLTLMNPAYMLSQIMNDYGDLYGIKGHVTSSKLINPKNSPDLWESNTLKIIESTKKPYGMKKINNDKTVYRYMSPLITDKGCLKCHGYQGYKVGDVRGAVSIAIPLSKYYNHTFKHSIMSSFILFAIYLFGIFMIVLSTNKIRKYILEKVKSFDQHIYAMVNMIEKRDNYTAGHTQRVAEYAVLIGTELNIPYDEIDTLKRACMLHDIGKIAIPDSILLKPGKLSTLEFSIIKEHASAGYDLLSSVDIYKDIAELVKYHHEKIDGTGYPHGLRGNDIPFLSQIMAVADAFDAMTTKRIYKSNKTVTEALNELHNLSGKHYNRKIVDAARIALSDTEINLEINQLPQTNLEEERFAYFYKDPITNAFNKDYLSFILSTNDTNKLTLKCVIGLNLHNFNKYNKTNGWDNGDKILAKVVEVLSASDYIFRVYGDDFVLLNLEHTDNDIFKPLLDNILKDTCITYSFSHFEIDKSIKSINDIEMKLK